MQAIFPMREVEAQEPWLRPNPTPLGDQGSAAELPDRIILPRTITPKYCRVILLDAAAPTVLPPMVRSWATAQHWLERTVIVEPDLAREPQVLVAGDLMPVKGVGFRNRL
ncbi:hypothetical protein HBB16_03680 [Pseudonocardia sp. MCCB 268]|nr:hypothetical protein [Pseudonocardia cytotoxica]